jgi:glycosyltransferase involved in cell wall biosynthesis
MNIISIVNVRWFNASAYFGLFQAQCLTNAGHCVTVVGNKNSPPIKKAAQWNLPAWSGAETEKFGLVKTPLLFWRFYKLLKTSRADLVIAHRGENYLVFFFAAALLKIPVIRVRGDQRVPRKDWASRLQHTYCTAHHIVTLKKMYNRYIDYGIPAKHISLMYGGAPAAACKKSPPHTPLNFGILGRLAPIKGHFDILAAFSQLDSALDWRLFIAGPEEGLTYNDLKREISSRQCLNRRVTLSGFVPDLEAFYEMIDVGIVASYESEVICRVGFEFMARGVPLIASRWNVMCDITRDGETAFLFTPRDTAHLASYISRFIRAPHLVRSMGDAAYARFMANYAPEVFTEKSDALVRQLYAQQRHSG